MVQERGGCLLLHAYLAFKPPQGPPEFQGYLTPRLHLEFFGHGVEEPEIISLPPPLLYEAALRDVHSGQQTALFNSPTQQQVESRLGELLKCRQPPPPTSPPPRAQPSTPRAGPWPLASQGPRLVFNRVNGRRPLATSPSLEGTQETYTLAHEENVRFVSEAWQQVEQQLDGGPAGESGPKPVQYVERTPDPRLQNFVPIDLDEWWAQQFLARITNCS
ncbi:MAPK regulated corepressor interacting protein 2 isoform X2 [Heterocephalus glaber]|uniref:MAPK regulated corepressor interacting protein 2 isoform X2 n=1 Tax=Heterocephalus glaber TaxID=10181 RepID=A0AAX6QHM9_HETGA|nr:MAPK regulated corepressor interacting protein 2 isoform X2 [Heterocephalus glaber]